MSTNRIAANAEYSRVGNMVCATCGKPISSGQFAYYEKGNGGDWKYVVHHRMCTESHPMWSSLDAKYKKAKERRISLLNACLSFRKEWGVIELDEIIEEIQQERQP